MKRICLFLVFIGVGILLFSLALITPIIVNTSDFSMYNTGWNGCSDIAIKVYRAGRFQPTFYVEEQELTLKQRSFADYTLDAQNASILIIGPRTTFSSREGAYIKEFLEEGGLLFLADDFGTANDLLQKINASSRFSGELLLDLSFEKKTSFVTVFDFLNITHPLTDNVSHIMLNFPTAINADKESLILAVSTEVSWLDVNLDEIQDTDEPTGPFPILVIESYGKGEIVLFSGPSLLINSMKHQLDNTIIRGNFLNYLVMDRDTVLIDEYHRDISTPLRLSYIVPSIIGFEAKVLILLLMVVVFLIVFTTIPRTVVHQVGKVFIRPKQTPKEIIVGKPVDSVMEKHPMWSRKKLEDIMKGLR